MPVPLSDRVRSALARLDIGGPVVVGASGGVDSTVLWRLLHEAGVATVGVHVNYGLREGSGADAASVQALGAELGMPVEVRRVRLPVEGNTQEAAREERYVAFAEAARRHGAGAVAVGHTADDQAETVLLNLVRGAGLAGLGGMAEARPLAVDDPGGVRLVRPLLGATRAEVEALARSRGWPWSEDATNAEGLYRRNRIRHGALPLLAEEGGPGTVRRIAAAAEAVREASGAVAARLDRVGTPLPGGGAVPLAALRVLHPAERRALVAEVLRRYAPEAPRSAAAVARVAALVDAAVGARVELGPADAWRERQRLAVLARRAPWAGAAVHVGGAVRAPGGTLSLRPLAEVPRTFGADPHRAVLDARALSGPLAVRPWREGDRLRPLGAPGSRLVSDVLTGARVPPSERRAQPVLVAGASGDRVVWVVGLRLAHAARVTPETAHAVEAVWTPEASGGAASGGAASGGAASGGAASG